ncbi:MAG: hypothetical protein PPP56_05660 [Longimonas sp.]|uniref:hypothetical protein n=1 Tax=Longimonas sp. TaxID=2039626 RepID=UPI00334AE16D
MRHLCAVFSLLVAGLICGPYAAAQQPKALPFDEASAYGVDREALEAEHGDAVHADSTVSVFPDRPDDVIDAWRGMFGALLTHLQAADVDWQQPTRGYFRVYVQPDGSIRHLLYKIHDGDLHQADGFRVALNDFTATYNFGLQADEPYAQCGTVMLQAP